MLIGSIILAGGSSERMGQPKPGLAWRDSSMLLDRIDTMLDYASSVVVVARDVNQELPPLNTDCELVFDNEPGSGPLGAVVRGMEEIETSCAAAIVLGCDFPFFDDDAARWLVDQLGEDNGAVPMNGDTPQPLCAIYRTSLLPDMQSALRADKRAAQALVDLPGVIKIDADAVRAFAPDQRFLFNVNTPDEYEQAKQWMS